MVMPCVIMAVIRNIIITNILPLPVGSHRIVMAQLSYQRFYIFSAVFVICALTLTTGVGLFLIEPPAKKAENYYRLSQVYYTLSQKPDLEETAVLYLQSEAQTYFVQSFILNPDPNTYEILRYGGHGAEAGVGSLPIQTSFLERCYGSKTDPEECL